MQQGVIFGLSETWLDGSFEDGELAVSGYDILRKDRNRRGGGVAVYINQSIKYKRREDLECDEIEALWLEVKESQRGRVLLCNLYRPPSSPSSVDDQIYYMMKAALNEGMGIIVMGGFQLQYL